MQQSHLPRVNVPYIGCQFEMRLAQLRLKRATRTNQIQENELAMSALPYRYRGALDPIGFGRFARHIGAG